MPPRLIAVDMDGTLLNSQGQVSPRNRNALHAAHEAGVEIVIATGRRHAYAMRVLRDLRLCAANAVVSSNGTVLRTIGAELIHRNHLPLSTAHWLCALLNNFRDTLVLTFDNVSPDGEERPGALVCETSHTLNANVDGWMRANQPYITRVDRIEHALKSPSTEHRPISAPIPQNADAGPIQAMLCGTVTRMAEAEALLATHPAIAGVGEPEFPGCQIVLHRTAYPERDLVILDILPAGCSKATALKQLAALRGCTLAEVMAIGDNWNDLPMLQTAGQAVLMGNAPPELHALARTQGWQIAPTNDQDGVAEVIETALPPVLAATTPIAQPVPVP